MESCSIFWCLLVGILGKIIFLVGKGGRVYYLVGYVLVLISRLIGTD
jgi:hypothetical protein